MWWVILYLLVGLLVARFLKIYMARAAQERRIWRDQHKSTPPRKGGCEWFSSTDRCWTCHRRFYEWGYWQFVLGSIVLWPLAVPAIALWITTQGALRGVEGVVKAGEIVVASPPAKKAGHLWRWYWEDPQDRKDRKSAA